MLRHIIFASILLAASAAQQSNAAGLDTKPAGKRPLKRNNAKRWENIHEVVRAEIKSATRQFLAERSRALIMPVAVDILLIGFDGDGGYGYKIQRNELEELLGTATEDNTICPTIWETGESAAVCFSINYLTLDNTRLKDALGRLEGALVHNMEYVGDRSQDWPDGSKDVRVYEVEASGEVEATVWDLVDQAYGGSMPEVNRDQHSQIVIINPSKRRMAASLPPAPGAEGHAEGGHGHHPAPISAAEEADFIGEWQKGRVSSAHIVEQEAGFLYRYRYNGHGGAAAFVGQYHFMVIDIAAGPVSYGPLSSPSGAVAPTAMPRLMPMLLRMTRELELHSTPGTLHEHILQQAARGQGAIFTGQLASAVAAATRHLFATDLLLHPAEALAAHTKRLVVPIIFLQDHMRVLEDEADGERWVDLDMVQLALDELLPPDVHGAVTVSRHMLHHHRQLLAAVAKAKHSRSEPVLAEPPNTGMHKTQAVSLDAALLMRELRHVQDDLVGALHDHLSDDYMNTIEYQEDPEAFNEQRARDSKVLPVFVFSLERSPDSLMFDNAQLVAAGPDMVLALQLLGSPFTDEAARGRVYSGHMTEGHHLLLDAAASPTRSIIAGLAAAVGGVVPTQQRHCGAEGGVVEDWRWSVGAVPWGPYSNYTAISSIFASTSRRNLLIARCERPLRRLLAAMDRLDTFIATHLQGPFAFLHAPKPRSRTLTLHSPGGSEGGAELPFGAMLPQHHLLDDLARHHKVYSNGTAGRRKGAKRNATAAGAGAAAGGGEGGEAPAPPGVEEDVELIADQQALTPHVAQRLQAKLHDIGSQLESVSFLMYSRSWAELEDALPVLTAAVEGFVAAAATDLAHAADVVACCAVRHAHAPALTWFIVVVSVALLGGFGVVAGLVIRSQRLYRPGGAGAGRPAGRPLSRRGSAASSGSLPMWTGPMPR